MATIFSTAIVTGGGRGIGRAICHRLAADGARVVAVARSRDELDETKRLVERHGGTCLTVRADVSQVDEMNAAVDETVRQFGAVDILVNNAGTAPRADVDAFGIDTFDAMIGVNVSAPFYAVRAVWPIMKQRRQGIIINISSVAAVDPFPGFAVYGATKAYIEGLTRGLAKEGRPLGIRVYGVGPGAVDTVMLRGPFPDFPDDQCLQPDDIAEVVHLMTQPVCRHAVGQTIYVTRS
ncbi:MAG: SDR family oxidoreductase [Phycisphaerales bacterium]|nr:SDR family oxidoreductase [Phycisphaerales bacterium]